MSIRLRVRQLDLVVLDALEALGHLLGGRPLLPLLVGRRQAPRQLLFARRLGGVARRRQRRAEDEMRVAVGGIPPNRLAQPVHRRRVCRFAAQYA